MRQCIKFYFIWSNALHVSDGLYVHHQEFKTVNTATGVCQTDTAVLLASENEMDVLKGGIHLVSQLRVLQSSKG
jgi:hypothetical protein